MPFVHTEDNTDIYYRDWGRGQAVVFVSGWALSGDMWQRQMLHLVNNGFRAICYDRRGHGRSDDSGHGYDFDTLADDLAAVVRHLNLTGMTLVAHSMGGGEVVRYLTRSGADRVKGIALVGTTLPVLLRSVDNPAGIDPALAELVLNAQRSDLPKWSVDNAPPYFGELIPGCDVSPATIDWTIRDGLRVSLHAAQECNLSNLHADFRTELAAIGVPAIVIHGDHDVSAPLDLCGRRTAALIPASRLKVYAGAPHGIYLTHGDQLNEDLLAFVSSAATPRVGEDALSRR